MRYARDWILGSARDHVIRLFIVNPPRAADKVLLAAPLSPRLQNSEDKVRVLEFEYCTVYTVYMYVLIYTIVHNLAMATTWPVRLECLQIYGAHWRAVESRGLRCLEQRSPRSSLAVRLVDTLPTGVDHSIRRMCRTTVVVIGSSSFPHVTHSLAIGSELYFTFRSTRASPLNVRWPPDYILVECVFIWLDCVKAHSSVLVIVRVYGCTWPIKIILSLISHEIPHVFFSLICGPSQVPAFYRVF